MALSALPGFEDDQTSMVALRAPVLPSLIPSGGAASTSNLDPMAGKKVSSVPAPQKAASNIPVQQVTPLTPGQLNEFETRLGQAGGRRIGGRRIGGKGGPGGTYVRGEFRGKTPSQAVAQMKGEYQGGRQPGAVAPRPAGGPTPGGIDGYNAMQTRAGLPVTPSARIPLSSVTPTSTMDAAREFRNSPAAQAAQDLLAYNHFIQTVDWKKYQTPAPVKPVAPAVKPVTPAASATTPAVAQAAATAPAASGAPAQSPVAAPAAPAAKPVKPRPVISLGSVTPDEAAAKLVMMPVRSFVRGTQNLVNRVDQGVRSAIESPAGKFALNPGKETKRAVTTRVSRALTGAGSAYGKLKGWWDDTARE